MSEPKVVNKSPQIGVRFPPEQMDRIRDFADEHYSGNVSVLVKVAVNRFIDAARPSTESAEKAEAAV